MEIRSGGPTWRSRGAGVPSFRPMKKNRTDQSERVKYEKNRKKMVYKVRFLRPQCVFRLMAGMYGILEGYFIQKYPFQNCYLLFRCHIFGV